MIPLLKGGQYDDRCLKMSPAFAIKYLEIMAQRVCFTWLVSPVSSCLTTSFLPISILYCGFGVWSACLMCSPAGHQRYCHRMRGSVLRPTQAPDRGVDFRLCCCISRPNLLLSKCLSCRQCGHIPSSHSPSAALLPVTCLVLLIANSPHSPG